MTELMIMTIIKDLIHFNLLITAYINFVIKGSLGGENEDIE